MRAAHASVPRKPDAAVWIEVPRLDLVCRRFDQSTKFLTLRLGNRCSQILDFGSMLSHKDNQCRFWDPADPRIADELRVERKQARQRFRVSAGCRLPVDEAEYAVNFAERINGVRAQTLDVWW